VTRRRLVAALLLAAAFVAVDAAPAFAHAILVSTDPPAGASPARGPETVTLSFNETVEASLGAIRLFDQRGQRLDAGPPVHPNGVGHEVRATLPSLRSGSYVVTWRVISADAHPVRGAFTFRVGDTAAGRNVDDLVGRLLTQQGGSTSVGVLFGIARFGVFTSMALLVGGVALVAALWPDGRTSRRASRVVWGAWAGALVSTVAAFALQGAYASGLPLSGAFRWNELVGVWHTRFGHVSVLRVAVLLAALVVLRRLFGLRQASQDPLPIWWAPAAIILGVVLVATPGLAGHASTGRWRAFSLPADVLHVGATGLWLGALAVLAACVLPVRDPVLLRSVVPRFSRLAPACILVIVATGVFQAWRQVGSVHGFTSTDYGRILLVKVGVVAVMLLAAGFSRDVVRRRLRQPYPAVPVEAAPALAGTARGAPLPERPGDAGEGEVTDVDHLEDWTEEDEERFEVRRLRQAVGVEVVLGVIVLAVTALLVNAPPAYNVTTGPFLKTVVSDGRYFDITVTPAKAGPNEVHITAVTKGGGPADVLRFAATVSEPGRDVAPISVPLLRLGPGHYASYGFDVPFPGTWQLTVRALLTATDETAFTVKLPIR
jgi:copper transport protein